MSIDNVQRWLIRKATTNDAEGITEMLFMLKSISPTDSPAHLHDEDSQQAMLALAGGNGVNNREAVTVNSEKRETIDNVVSGFEGSLRANRQSRIGNHLQVLSY